MAEHDARWMAGQMEALARADFGIFAVRAFRTVHTEPYLDNWHIWTIAHHLKKAVTGESRRLMITMPPRSMKSFIGSVALPAWLLGRNPGERIICASYAQSLSSQFALETRQLMQTGWYKRVFPGTHLDPKKSSVEALGTTRGGQRRATSVGGTLTGFGAEYLIIDDPMKANDAYSDVARENAFQWFGNTAASRLDNPKKGRTIVIAQRLHMEDLPGQLLAAEGGWDLLELPLIEFREREIEIESGRTIIRPAGHLLHEERIGEEEIARLRAEMGEQNFEAQYNQRPLPAGGALFRQEWLQRYNEPPKVHQVQGIFQSWDTAYETAEGNDYSVCTTWALSGKRCYLLDVYRERLAFPALEKAVYRLREQWKADLVIVEKAGSGISLFQNIYDPGIRPWIQTLRPEGSKQDRASQQSPKFERGEVWLPREAPWLKTLEDELLSFPHGKYDDQVDSIVQFLAAVDTGYLLVRADQARRRR